MNIFKQLKKQLLREFYDVEPDTAIEMTIVSLGTDEDGIETLELDGIQFCRAEDEELENAIDICIEEEFMPEWEEKGIVSYNIDSVHFDKEDGNGIAFIGLFGESEDIDETLESVNEGDVVSFADFKAEKEADKAIEGAEDEVIHAKILGVQTVNYNIDGSQILDSRETYDFKYLQTILHALGQILRMQDSTDAIALRYDIVLNDGKEEQKLIHAGDVILGSDIAKESMLNDLETYFDGAFDKTVIIDGDLLPSDREVSKKVLELQKQLRLDKESGIAKAPAEAKDYSNGETKFGQDVEIGDILYYSYNYGSTQHYFLKVVDKKGASIKLSKLEKITKLISDDNGEVVPSNIIEPNVELEKKWFRIHKSKADWDNVVCKFNDRSCYYWNGKPKHETYMD